MGMDKARLPVGSESMVGRQIRLLCALCRTVAIIGPPDRFPEAGIQVYEDEIAGQGPLGGLYTGLCKARTEFSLFLGCDMPLMDARFLRYLCQQALVSQASATVPPRGAKGVYPLCAVLRRGVLSTVRASLAMGQKRLGRFFEKLQRRTISKAEFARAGFSPRIFYNANTPEDYEKVRRQFEAPHQPMVVAESEQWIYALTRGEKVVRQRNMSSNGLKSVERPYFQFVHVYKAFDGQQVLEDVSFDVRRGETLVVLGKSGVGKSVTLKHILGFLQPDTGQVFVAGLEVSNMPEEELLNVRRRVTMVFQSGALFDSLTVGENVAYPLRERAERGLALDEDKIQARVGELLAMVELDGVRDLMPSDLSTGMKRAVAIARALAAKPEAILYDEPTTMVDPLMAQTIADLILKLKRQAGLTSVVVTHDMKLARKLGDRAVFLVDGRVAFFGPMNELDKSEEPMVQAFIWLDEVSFLKNSRESRVESRE